MRYFFPDYCAIEDVSIIGDGSCDAEAAIAFCNFDGGDCSSTILYLYTTDFINMLFEDQGKTT